MVHKNRSEDKATKYAAAIQKKLKAANIETELVYCDWENIEEITRVARDLILQESSNEVAINLASGSKNHAIGLDRACMTFRKRKHIHPFYPEAERWTAWRYPKQQSVGVKKIKQISNPSNNCSRTRTNCCTKNNQRRGRRYPNAQRKERCQEKRFSKILVWKFR